MNGPTYPVGGTTRCPRCDSPLVFISKYAVLAERPALSRSGLEEPRKPVRHEPAWVCRNGACHYHQLVSDL